MDIFSRNKLAYFRKIVWGKFFLSGLYPSGDSTSVFSGQLVVRLAVIGSVQYNTGSQLPVARIYSRPANSSRIRLQREHFQNRN